MHVVSFISQALAQNLSFNVEHHCLTSFINPVLGLQWVTFHYNLMPNVNKISDQPELLKGSRKGRCNKSNDGCGESNSTVPKNSANEKNCADGAKLCTNETEPSATCVLFEAVKCIKCEKTGLRLHLSESNCGEAVKFHLKNVLLVNITILFNSKKCDSSENYELNTRLVYAMRCIGKSAESARMFCGIMNLPRHPQNSQSTTTFYCRQQEKPVNTVWQKLFVKPLMKMMEKGTLLLLLMVAGRSVVFLRRMAW
ncbi:hypothetical protein TNCV_1902591 [Trichonephila clavipes]|nr:hypothetical protein TNCV_1902591 [Trichonephila clavipes]